MIDSLGCSVYGINVISCPTAGENYDVSFFLHSGYIRSSVPTLRLIKELNI